MRFCILRNYTKFFWREPVDNVSSFEMNISTKVKYTKYIPLIKSSSFDNISVDNSSLLNTLIVYDILKDVNIKSKSDIDPYVISI